MFMKWKINYYITENSFRSGVPAFYETISGDRNFVVNWAQNKIKLPLLKSFSVIIFSSVIKL